MDDTNNYLVMTLNYRDDTNAQNSVQGGGHFRPNSWDPVEFANEFTLFATEMICDAINLDQASYKFATPYDRISISMSYSNMTRKFTIRALCTTAKIFYLRLNYTSGVGLSSLMPVIGMAIGTSDRTSIDYSIVGPVQEVEIVPYTTALFPYNCRETYIETSLPLDSRDSRYKGTRKAILGIMPGYLADAAHNYAVMATDSTTFEHAIGSIQGQIDKIYIRLTDETGATRNITGMPWTIVLGISHSTQSIQPQPIHSTYSNL
jgi:hypothetical protein